MIDDPSDELIFPRSTAATPQSAGPAQQADPGLIKRQMAEAASAAARDGNAIPEHVLWEKAYKGMKQATLPTLWSHISKGNADGGYFRGLGKRLQSTA